MQFFKSYMTWNLAAFKVMMQSIFFNLRAEMSKRYVSETIHAKLYNWMRKILVAIFDIFFSKFLHPILFGLIAQKRQTYYCRSRDWCQFCKTMTIHSLMWLQLSWVCCNRILQDRAQESIKLLRLEPRRNQAWKYNLMLLVTKSRVRNNLELNT